MRKKRKKGFSENCVRYVIIPINQKDVSEYVCLSVCVFARLFANSSETANPIELKEAIAL